MCDAKYWYKKYQYINTSSKMVVIKLVTMEVVEVMVQLMYLHEISQGDNLVEPQLIRVQLYTILMNSLISSAGFVWAVIIYISLQFIPCVVSSKYQMNSQIYCECF